jgi:hypothetical protein
MAILGCYQQLVAHFDCNPASASASTRRLALACMREIKARSHLRGAATATQLAAMRANISWETLTSTPHTPTSEQPQSTRAGRAGWARRETKPTPQHHCPSIVILQRPQPLIRPWAAHHVFARIASAPPRRKNYRRDLARRAPL